MGKNSVNEIENISLSAKQIKNKLEDALAYDHNKYHNEILFDLKPNQYYKLPFSDYKIAISEELANQQLLLENLQQYISEAKLIEEKEVEEIFDVVIEEKEEEEHVNIIEEVYEFDEIKDEVEEFEEEFIDDEEEFEEFEGVEDDDDEFATPPHDNKAKRPKGTIIKVVDVKAVIEKIKREAIEKNKGKPVIGRRQINKMLKPYMIKRNVNIDIDGLDGLDDSLTSIDIYLNAVNKIANTTDSPIHEHSNDALELNIHEIIDDLEK